METLFINSLNLTPAEQNVLETPIATFKQAFQKNPKDYSAYFDLAFSLQTANKLEQALNAYNHVLELNPNYAEAYNNIGTILQDTNQLDNAIEAYHKSIETDPGYIDAHFNLGSALQDKGNYEEAAHVYYNVLSLNHRHFDALYNLGIVLQNQRKNDEALRAYHEAINLNPNHAQAYYNMGIILYHQGNLSDALEAFEYTLREDINDCDAHYNKGNVLKDQGKLEEAIKSYKNALNINPKHISSLYNLGTLFKYQGKFEDAICAYGKVIEIDSHHVMAYCSRGNLYNQLNLEEQALADFGVVYQFVKENKGNTEISDKNKAYITQMLGNDRDKLLMKLSKLQKVTVETENLVQSLDPKEESIQSEMKEFTILKRNQQLVTNQAVDTMSKSNNRSDSSSKTATVQVAVSELQNLEEKMTNLQKQLLEYAKLLEKHDKVLHSAGVYDKANIKEEFRSLAVDQPELYRYCKVFYWTLANYLAAYRTLGTNLPSGNIDIGRTIKEKLFEKGTKKVTVFAKMLMQGVPMSGQVIGVFDNLIQLGFDTKKRAKFNEKVNAVNMLITLSSDSDVNLEEDLSYLCANTAIKLAHVKKEKILKAGSMQKEPLTQLSVVKLRVKEIKEMVLPSIGLHGCPATDMALKDVALLLVYVYHEYEEMLGEKQPLEKQFVDVILQKKWKSCIVGTQLEGRMKDSEMRENVNQDEQDGKQRCNMF